MSKKTESNDTGDIGDWFAQAYALPAIRELQPLIDKAATTRDPGETLELLGVTGMRLAALQAVVEGLAGDAYATGNNWSDITLAAPTVTDDAETRWGESGRLTRERYEADPVDGLRFTIEWNGNAFQVSRPKTRTMETVDMMRRLAADTRLDESQRKAVLAAVQAVTTPHGTDTPPAEGWEKPMEQLPAPAWTATPGKPLPHEEKERETTPAAPVYPVQPQLDLGIGTDTANEWRRFTRWLGARPRSMDAYEEWIRLNGTNPWYKATNSDSPIAATTLCNRFSKLGVIGHQRDTDIEAFRKECNMPADAGKADMAVKRAQAVATMTRILGHSPVTVTHVTPTADTGKEETE